jgi:hypothetical protein
MSRTTTTQSHSTIGRFFRDPGTGRVVVVQWPNLPLWIWLAVTFAKLVLAPGGAVGQALSVVGTLSLIVWAVLEVARGQSPFRRVLGGLVLAGMLLGRLLG